MSEKQHPPKWVERLLTSICDPARLEAILGDLEEINEEKIAQKSTTRVNLSY